MGISWHGNQQQHHHNFNHNHHRNTSKKKKNKKDSSNNIGGSKCQESLSCSPCRNSWDVGIAHEWQHQNWGFHMRNALQYFNTVLVTLSKPHGLQHFWASILMKDSVSWIWSRWKQINIEPPRRSSQRSCDGFSLILRLSRCSQSIEDELQHAKKGTFLESLAGAKRLRSSPKRPWKGSTKRKLSTQAWMQIQQKYKTWLDLGTPFWFLLHDAPQWYFAWPSRRKAWSFLYDWPEWCQRKEQEYTQGPVDTICRLDLMHNNVMWCRKMM